MHMYSVWISHRLAFNLSQHGIGNLDLVALSVVKQIYKYFENNELAR